MPDLDALQRFAEQVYSNCDEHQVPPSVYEPVFEAVNQRFLAAALRVVEPAISLIGSEEPTLIRIREYADGDVASKTFKAWRVANLTWQEGYFAANVVARFNLGDGSLPTPANTVSASLRVRDEQDFFTLEPVLNGIGSRAGIRRFQWPLFQAEAAFTTALDGCLRQLQFMAPMQSSIFDMQRASTVTERVLPFCPRDIDREHVQTLAPPRRQNDPTQKMWSNAIGAVIKGVIDTERQLAQSRSSSVSCSDSAGMADALADLSYLLGDQTLITRTSRLQEQASMVPAMVRLPMSGRRNYGDLSMM